MLLAVLGLFCGGAHGVIAEDGEEDGGGTGQDRAEATGHERVVVLGVDVENTQADDEQDQDDLDGNGYQFKPAECLGAPGSGSK